MFGQRFRSLFTKSGPRTGRHPDAAEAPPPPPAEKEHVKRSLGLSQFVNTIRDETGLSILDLGGISQPNVTFLTDLGHRLYSVDFLRTLDSISSPGAPAGGPVQRNLMESFLQQTLDYGPEELDGALIWDSLQYLSRPLLLATVDRLHRILKPGACMLAFFDTAEKAKWLPLYSYRITSSDSLRLTWKTHRPAVEVFNNRGIEKTFERFDSLKFFLTRDNLREVIIRR